MRTLLRISALSICVLLLAAAPRAFAVNRDIVALQAQVDQMQQMMISMQQTNDERYAVMHNLLQQTSESISKVASQVDSMQKAAQSLQSSEGNSLQQLSGQMQSMNDSLDELRARLDKFDKELASIQQQQQSLAAGQPVLSGQSGQAMPANGQPGGNQAEGTATGQPQGVAPNQPPTPQAPPLDQLYQSAATDYNAAKYNLSSQEFADVVKFYPQTPQAANAQFYMGEIDYRAGNYKSAIDNYAAVLTQYPGSPKAPTAQLRKAESELAMGQREAGIRDLRSLIQRYPQTPEAMRARSRLNGMGVRIYPKPNPGHE